MMYKVKYKKAAEKKLEKISKVVKIRVIQANRLRVNGTVTGVIASAIIGLSQKLLTMKLLSLLSTWTSAMTFINKIIKACSRRKFLRLFFVVLLCKPRSLLYYALKPISFSKGEFLCKNSFSTCKDLTKLPTKNILLWSAARVTTITFTTTRVEKSQSTQATATIPFQIAGSYSSEVSGSDIFLAVGNDEIFLIDADNLEKVNIKTGQSSTSNSFKLSGTTATYGTSKKTLFTINGIKSTSGLKVSGKVVTVSKAALGTSKVTISNGYHLR